MKPADHNDFIDDSEFEHVQGYEKRHVRRPIATGLIAAISRAIAVQNWDEARRLADREDSSEKI